MNNRLKQVSIIAGIVSLLGTCIVGLNIAFNPPVNSASPNTQPGTADDPVVTKSYVDQQIQKALGGGGATPNPAEPTAPAVDPNAVNIVTLKPGQILIGKAGAEFIVRSGLAVIYTQDQDGVADLTDGKDLVNGETAPKNHLLSFPRDGRGIQVKQGQSQSLVVMVRGGYAVQ
ncbi:hypothetical protein ACH6EH_08250 [Paenibacillus sp. JSM ZJ436]|uniref:hypothetical protein n=1 Tax=Paenibacillus sp. JSM ZJ436 TaxID=3376190 RepID=UPI003788609D